MNKKQLIVICIFSLLIIPSFSFANNSEKTDDEIIKQSKKLDAICLELEKPMPDKEKAELLYEKSRIMLTYFWLNWLNTGTESLLEAIKLAPERKEYKDFLLQVYNNLWKDRDFSGNDEISVGLRNTKKEVEKVLSISNSSSGH